jgi:cytoskeletal protein RodZ
MSVNIQDNNEQILNDIQSLQQMEQQLFSNLESNPNLSTSEQEKIITKMNQLSTMRVNLYKMLSGVNNFAASTLTTSTGSLQQQTVAVNIIENELNVAKQRLAVVEEERNNKIRMVEINNYYSDKYAEHAQLMKIIICTLIPIIIFALLNNKGILPNTIYYILLVIVSIIGAIFFWTRFASIVMRDNMNYQEYAWTYNPDSSNNSTTTSSTTSTDPWYTAGAVSTASCVGDGCCSTGLTYDASMNQCVTSTTTTTTTPSPTSVTESFITESMINNVLTKTQPEKYKTDYSLKEPRESNS